MSERRQLSGLKWFVVCASVLIVGLATDNCRRPKKPPVAVEHWSTNTNGVFIQCRQVIVSGTESETAAAIEQWRTNTTNNGPVPPHGIGQ